MYKAHRKLPLFLMAVVVGTSCSQPNVVEKSDVVGRAISSESDAPIESSLKIKYPWPANYEVVDMDEMTGVIRTEMAKDLSLQAKKTTLGSVSWDGVKRLDYILTQRDVSGRFTRTSFNLHKEKGKEPLDVMIWSFIHVGMDQGIRDFNNGARVTKIRDNVNALEVLLKEPSKWADQIESILEELNSGLKGISENPEIIMKEMKSLAVQETEQANARSFTDLICGYYLVSAKDEKQPKLILEKFLLDNYEIAKEQGIRLQLRDNRTILSLEQRVLEKTLTDLKKNKSLSKNDVEFLKASLGQLRERLN